MCDKNTRKVIFDYKVREALLIYSANWTANWCIIAPKNFCLQTRFNFHGNGIMWISLHTPTTNQRRWK